ncbi:hypothetical protein NCCP2222_19120 [Sporosarcina sp. NCCP-2222]|nr:hypothetical protein NCCP2222_19120 [Sporosarcina sp. NCCP-2222]
MTAIQSIAPTNISVMALDTKLFDTSRLWDASVSGFRIREAGRYAVVGTGLLSTANCSKTLRVYAYQSGTGTSKGNVINSSYDSADPSLRLSLNVVGVFDLEENDFVRLLMSHTSTTTLNTVFAGSCELAIYKV